MISEYLLKIYWNESFQILGEFFSNLKFPCAYVKGDALSLHAYGKVGKRQSKDIDLLVSRQNIANIFEELKKLGFKSTSSSRMNEVALMSCSHQISPWTYHMPIWGKIVLDLNFDILWGEYSGKRIDIDEFLSDSIDTEIYGVRIKTLTPIKTLIQLCLHHYKDMNSIFLLATRKSIKYDMFKDVYYLLKNNLDTISLDKLYEKSIEYEIAPYMFYVLYYTGQVFDDDILKQYIEAFRNTEGEKLINCYGLCAKERKEWKYDFKTRLESNNLYDLIKDDLTDKDREKIAINKRIFMGDRDEIN